MSNSIQDPLWPHFVPLWNDLRVIAPGLLLAGGYGLFLKQCWLDSQIHVLGTEDGRAIVTGRGDRILVDEIQTLVILRRWKDQTPRVTKDFDIIAGLDVIASVEEQGQLHSVLEKHEFEVVPKNARWQFEKKIGERHTILLDFHTPSPEGKREDLRVQSRRVKPQPSLHQTGIHGHENAEAIRSELHPFSFNHDGVQIVVPNPVTMACMKLVAMRDRRLASQNSSKSADERQMEESQARKHANDVCRVMGMMTREESDLTGNVLEAIRSTRAFVEARETFSNFFQNEEGWGVQAVAGSWEPEDLRLIQSTLAAWFR